MSVLDTLVTDRTLEDALARNEKGIYTAKDMNRVGQAVEELAEIFRQRGYIVPVDPKTDWPDTAGPTRPILQGYLANVSTMRNILAMPSSTPPVPASMRKFTWEEANDIEKILADIDWLLTLMAQSFRRCGNPTTLGGARGLPTENCLQEITWAELDAKGWSWADWDSKTWFQIRYGR